MKGLVEVIARALVDDPTPVEVFQAGTADEPVYRLKVGKDDLGTVDGERGADGLADGTSGTGDEGDLVVELDFHEWKMITRDRGGAAQ